MAGIHCNALQSTATHGNTLQHIATHCNTIYIYIGANGETNLKVTEDGRKHFTMGWLRLVGSTKS